MDEAVGSVSWATYNEPKDAAEASAIYSQSMNNNINNNKMIYYYYVGEIINCCLKEMAEWIAKTGGKDQVKMAEIQTWFQATMTRISQEAFQRASLGQ